MHIPMVWILFSNSFRGARGSTDQDFRTSCPTCGLEVTLDEAEIDAHDPLELVYHCPAGCGPLLIVSTPSVVPWAERGHVYGKWMMRNPRDVVFYPRGTGCGIVIPASPDAFV